MKPPAIRQVLNQLLNLFWTAVCSMPLIIYWVRAEKTYLLPLLALSIPGIFISSKIYQLSKRTRVYKSLGVKWVRFFVQDGDLIGRLTGKSGEPRIITNRTRGRKYLKTIMVYERFHVLCFLFFTFTTIHAVWFGDVEMAMVITGSNIIYNIYPLLLQQYNRIRVERMV